MYIYIFSIDNIIKTICLLRQIYSQHDRWCCNIFKTSNLNKELEYLPKNGKSLSFLGIRHSESVARSTYERTQEPH